jgi:CHAD domain-containing protein
MREVTADTHTWLAARAFLLARNDDFSRQLTRSMETLDPEAIHDLRVSSRRLLEGIALFGNCFRKRALALLRKELKGLITMLGSIRNRDEALLFFTPLGEKSDEFCTASVMHIAAVLQSGRKEEQRQLKRELGKIAQGSLPGRLSYICSKPRIFAPRAEGLFQPIAATLIEAMAAREKTILELLPEALKEGNIAAQHRLRIAVKRFRYRMEFLAPLASDDYKHVYSVVKAYQDILGRLHDLQVFSDLAGEMTTGPLEAQCVINIIRERRKILFDEFLHLHAVNPLDEMGRRVRGLL